MARILGALGISALVLMTSTQSAGADGHKAGVDSASAATPNQAKLADRIMREATARMTHESATQPNQDQLSVEELIARYDRGERLYIMCGRQSMVSQTLLQRAGLRSRIVGTLASSGPWDGGSSHAFLEVWTGRRWITYDPDGNRQPVDTRDHAIGAVRAVNTRPFHWRYISSDIYDEAYPDYTYGELDVAADHAMGILGIQIHSDPLQYGYLGTPENVARVQSNPATMPPWWIPVGKKRWAKITRDDA
jgi:hypothetical protein